MSSLRDAAHENSLDDDHADDIVYPSTIPFLLVHLACFAAIWTGVTAEALALCAAFYVIRIFGIGAGYHRYFAHRTYKTSRVFQFLLALLAQSSAQRGVLWWAAKHRWHHKHSDTALDVHSPRQRGFLHAHLGWIFTPRHGFTDYGAVPDLARYPELVWLDRHPYLPAALLAAAAWAIAGWPGLVVGFCWSTVAVWHATFCINSLAHVAGRRRYVTGDDSRNNWVLAILTMGEGWHNNHHAYQSSVRQGFRWWEYDPTFYVLKVLSWCRIVRDLHTPPMAVLRGEQKLGRKVIEKVAHQLAASFPVDRIAAQASEALAHTPIWTELQARAQTARSQAEALLADVRLPHMPSLEEVRRYAQTRLVRTPSLDDIAGRTRQILLEAVAARLLDDAAVAGRT
ncbi:MAG TPA: acyl-CoA desaturase [Alphaproteobacteria bacterium]|nr:acyl-CoA desaturase [Alphaproteobacteria bacterium]